MGSLVRGRESDSGKLLLDLSSDAAGSEWSTTTEHSVASENCAKTDACLYRGTDDDDVQELMGEVKRRCSFKVAKGLARISSSKFRRPVSRKGLGGAEQKKKLKKLRSMKLVSLDSSSSRRKWNSSYDQRSTSSNVADASPNYLKATRSSDVRKTRFPSSSLKPESGICSSDGEEEILNSSKPIATKNKPIIAFKSMASLRPMRILAKMPSLKPKRPSTRKCSEITEVSDSSVHRPTCSSAIKDSKFPAQVENKQGENVSEKNSAAKVCPYSYCSLHGHRHAAPTLKRLKSARKRVKSQKSKKLDGLSRGGAKDFGRASSRNTEKVDKESTHEINCREDAGLNADDRQDKAEEVAEVVVQERKQQSETAETANRWVAGKENLRQACGSPSQDHRCSEPSSTSQEAHTHRESEEDILESINAEKKEKEESEESPGSRGRKFVSTGTQTDLELEDLGMGNDLSAADHTANDPHEEIQEAVQNVQETGDDIPLLSGDLSWGCSTANNEEMNSSKTSAIDEEADVTAVGSVLATEELIFEHRKIDDNPASPGEPEVPLPNSREETALSRDKMEKCQESPGEPTEVLSGSAEEPTLACKVDENQESPAESELDSTSDDSFKSSFGRRKFNGLWYLIYQHMVSDAAENGGMESPVHRENKEEQVINANMLPTLDRDPEVGNHGEAAQQEQLQQSDAIKLLQEAISRILEQNRDQFSIRTSTAGNASSDNTETGDDQSTDRESEREPDLEEEKLAAQKVTIEEKRGVNAGGGPNPLASKRWSNLKKYILMKRFIKAMEKTKNFSWKLQRSPSPEVFPEQEKVSLRSQSIGERKMAEEWMLDHALQKVISKLDPAQKRRVNLLVEAFETVNPIPGGKTCLSKNTPSPSTVVHSAARETILFQSKERTSTENVSSAKLLTRKTPSASDECIKVEERLCGSCEDGNGDWKASKKLIASSIEHPSEVIFASEKSGVSSRPVPPQLSTDRDNTRNMDQAGGPGEGTADEIRREEIQGSVSSSPGHSELSDPTEASGAHDWNVKLMSIGEPVEAVVEKEVVSGSSQAEERRLISVPDVAEESQSEKKKYTGLWYLIYKHMASDLATAQGSEPIDPLDEDEKKGEEEEEAENQENGKKSRSVDIGNPDTLDAHHNMLAQRIDSEEMKLRKIEAVKLVQQAIDEIPLECEDSTSHGRSNAGNGVLEQESKETSCTTSGETSLPTSSDSTEDSYLGCGKVKEHKPLLDPEIQLKSGETAQRGEETTDFQEVNKSNLRPMKNWSNLRKVILLKRFVKALEKVRNFNPREPRLLPLDPDMGSEKVNLKHQDMDERKNAEEYLLDYALQQVVSRLTPARKRKVHLLVEAFETVTPPLRS